VRKSKLPLINLAFALVYTAVGWGGLHIYSMSGFATPLWIPTGLSLVAVWMLDYTLWPGVLAGAFLTNYLSGASLPMACLFGIGNTLEAVVGVYALKRYGFRPTLNRLRDVICLLVLAGLFSTLISASLGIATLALFHKVAPSAYFSTWSVWWRGDILSDWVVAPFLFVWLHPRSFKEQFNKQTIEEGVVFLLLGLFTTFIFSQPVSRPLGILQHPYLIFPPIVWAALRFGPRGSVSALFITTAISVFHTLSGFGPFGVQTVSSNLASWQLFISVLSVSGLILSAIAAERTESRQLIANSERRFRSLIENSSDGILLLSAEGHIMYIAPTRRRVLGYADEELIGRSVFEILHPDDRPRLLQYFQELLADPTRTLTAQARAIHQDGSWRWLEGTGSNCLSNASMRGIVVNFRDVTVTKEAEAALKESHEELEHRVDERTRELIAANNLLRESEERFRLLVEGVEEYALYGLDVDGHIITWNTGAERLKGYPASEILGKHFSHFYTPEDIHSGKPSELLRLAETEGKARAEAWRVRKDGSRFFADVLITALRDKAGNLKGFVKLTRDITERRNAEQALQLKEEELLQARKLEAIGRLAGGVAHDFNNLITGILGITQDLKGTMSVHDPRREELEEVIKASNRAFDVTRQLLAFGRRQIIAPKVIDLNGTIRDFVRLLHRLIGEDVKLNLQLASASFVKMDPGNLGQVLLNLTLNARDAMPQGGTIRIRTESYLSKDEKARPLVLLEVEDSGKGMSEEILSHIFEPFFTTKTKDKGTGLGLATVYGIVKQSGGDITVRSVEGQGTMFQIVLPREAQNGHPEETANPAHSASGHETLLVIEDEDIVRRVVVKRLKNAGYNVYEASDGKKALALLEQENVSVQMVITDVVMPEMNGREVVNRIRMTRPQIAVLYMSGYPEEIIAHRGTLEPGINFIEKSSIQKDLLHKVRDVLEKTYALSLHSSTPRPRS
jgi:PAS domain S-box-containing protein